MSAGAAYGAGIYLSPFASTSIGYSHAMQGWKLSKFNKSGNLQCIAICEVIDAGYKANPHFVGKKRKNKEIIFFFFTFFSLLIFSSK